MTQLTIQFFFNSLTIRDFFPFAFKMSTVTIAYYNSVARSKDRNNVHVYVIAFKNIVSFL